MLSASGEHALIDSSDDWQPGDTTDFGLQKQELPRCLRKFLSHAAMY